MNQLLKTIVPSSLVRRDLLREFLTGEDRVTDGNCLDFRAHWAAILKSLGRHSPLLQGSLDPSGFHFVCADLVYQGQGDTVGTPGGLTYDLARQGTNHFVPLIRRLSRGT